MGSAKEKAAGKARISAAQDSGAKKTKKATRFQLFFNICSERTPKMNAFLNFENLENMSRSGFDRHQ